MSAHRDAQNASALGVKSILSKPFDVDALLDTVGRLLQMPSGYKDVKS
jgi:DNA-binding NtrC family response regulator